MSDIGGKLKMFYQMRWRDALEATGAETDETTDRLISIHQTIIAMEAALAAGYPEQVWDVDIDGCPLTTVGAEAQAGIEVDEPEVSDNEPQPRRDPSAD